MENSLMNIEELSEYIKVKKASIYDLVYHRRIPYIKIGRRLRFKRELINIWLEKSTHIPASLEMKILSDRSGNKQ